MIRKLDERFLALKEHHKIFVALLIAIAVICVTWGVEKLLEHYFFPNKPVARYVIAVIGGLIVLYLIKHVLLQEI